MDITIKKSKKNSLSLFFTLGVSVENWKNTGLIDREKLIYNKLINEKIYDNIYLFTYGDNDKKLKINLDSKINVIEKPRIFKGTIGNIAYSFFFTNNPQKNFEKMHRIKNKSNKWKLGKRF